jgi:hypothetical protein
MIIRIYKKLFVITIIAKVLDLFSSNIILKFSQKKEHY